MARRNTYSTAQLKALYADLETNGLVSTFGFGLVFRVFLQAKISDGAKYLGIYLSTMSQERQSNTTIKNILTDLTMTRSTYYAARKELVACGFLTVSKKVFNLRSAQIGTQCMYKMDFSPDNPILKEVVQNSPRVQRHLSEKNTSDITKIEYGTLPRSVLLNKNLSRNAKLLYAYLVTFSPAMPAKLENAAGTDFYAITKPRLTKLSLNFSDKRYARAINELISWNFIERVKISVGVVTYRINYQPSLEAAYVAQDELKEKHSHIKKLRSAAANALANLNDTLKPLDPSGSRPALKMIREYYQDTFDQALKTWSMENGTDLNWISTTPAVTWNELIDLTFNKRLDVDKSLIVAQLNVCYRRVVDENRPIHLFPTYFVKGLELRLAAHQERQKQNNLPVISLHDWLRNAGE